MKSDYQLASLIVTVILAAAFTSGVQGAEPVAQDRVEFNRDVRPILSDNCFYCHGPDKNQRQAELRLDLREAAIAAKAIVPGDLQDSELITRILSDDADLLMPPPARTRISRSNSVRFCGDGLSKEPSTSSTGRSCRSRPQRFRPSSARTGRGTISIASS